MCVSTAPAHFSDTILYAAEVELKGAGIVHVLGYQNKAQNLAVPASQSQATAGIPTPDGAVPPAGR